MRNAVRSEHSQFNNFIHRCGQRLGDRFGHREGNLTDVHFPQNDTREAFP